ncbi:MAG: hypothetical protein J7K40_02800, partial [candidate division Zixibacteria bacterium]|nr:hypothetical protein [candidate division Zixibacteria bacterium]
MAKIEHQAVTAFPVQWKVFDYESVDVEDSAVGLTSGTYDDAIRAEMTLETAQIRYRVDGTDPT